MYFVKELQMVAATHRSKLVYLSTMSNLFVKEESKQHMKTIVFDLDETLVHVISIPEITSVNNDHTYIIPAPQGNGLAPYKNKFLQVMIRPGC